MEKEIKINSEKNLTFVIDLCYNKGIYESIN